MAIEDQVFKNFTDTIVNRANAVTMRGVTGYISEFARLVNNKSANKKDIKDANRRLAKTAQNAALNRYDSRRAASDTPGEYRVGEGRISGGRLRAAIANPNFITFDADGFGIGSRQVLNKEVAHWARINYSAGPQGMERPTVSFRFDQREVGRIRSRIPVAPLWSIPRGTYFKGGELHVNTRGGGLPQSEVVKKAHEPYHFIEAGLEAAANDFSREYETMMFAWLNKAGQQAKNFTNKGIRVKNVYLK